MAHQNGELRESLVVGLSSQGLEVRASLLKLTRYQAVFEIYSPGLVLSTSEVLSDLRIIINDQTIYSGRAIVSGIVNTGTMLVCEAKVEETGFLVPSFAPGEASTWTQRGFDRFFHQWQKLYRVETEFKVAVADMQTFLSDLRLWLEQLELEIRAAPSGDRLAMERDAVHQAGEAMVPAFDQMHERLEAVSEKIEPELRPVHQNFSQRQLHPLMMCSPFAYRTFQKPLGYAGDYEMVNMIARDPYEGGSLFAKVVNLWFLSQWPAKAHRNRIAYLTERITEESLRGQRSGRPIRVLNLGCGPAREIQAFLAQDRICEFAEFSLLDFNPETVQHVTDVLNNVKKQHGRGTRIQVQKKSVQQLLKEGGKPQVQGAGIQYDLVYCAGLFDYLPDRTCKHLMSILYNWLAPGGLLVATNVDCTQPFRHMLEFVLDWHLIYRDTNRVGKLLPERAPADSFSIKRDSTLVNLLIEVRRPENG
jgi:extracellular factor (EF) 3-hydroxypalmitic acid methyl ester biosynthesis protein